MEVTIQVDGGVGSWLGITDSGVSMTTGSDGAGRGSGPCCPWWWGALLVLESEF